MTPSRGANYNDDSPFIFMKQVSYTGGLMDKRSYFGASIEVKPRRSSRRCTMDTTREKASSSAGFRCISSAGTRATNTALQLTHSSSACPPALLLYKSSSSAVVGSSLPLVALALFGRTRYCYCGADANFCTLATANLSSFFWHICFVFEQAL